MNIALFSDNFYPELSGIGDMLLALADGLAAAGHRVAVCAPKYPATAFKRSHVPSGEYNFKHPVEVFRYSSIGFPTGTGQGRLVLPSILYWRHIEKFKPDIIHSQLFFGMGIEALQIARKLKLPLLGTNHTVISEFKHYAPLHSEAIANALSRFVIWYYNQCNYVTAPANSLLKSMEAEGLTRPHTAVPNPIDTDLFSPVTSQKKAKFKKELGFGNNTICYAGRLAPEKRVDECIQALPQVRALVPDAELILAGHGTERGKLEQLARSVGVAEHVKFLGTLDKPGLAKMYAASDVFATMSTSENQPLTLLQAYAMGLPAVGARANGLIEHIPLSSGRLVEPHDVSGFAHTISAILKTKSVYEQLHGGALAFAKQFATATVVKEWVTLYNTVCTKFV
jgi:glycosyltransferase involved in cell wall biosynthesis